MKYSTTLSIIMPQKRQPKVSQKQAFYLQNDKFWHLYCALSSKQQKLFAKYMGFRNSEALLTKLFRFFEKLVGNPEKAVKVEDIQIWTAYMGDKSINKRKLKQHLSTLGEMLEDFLIWDRLRSNKIKRRIEVAEIYKEHNLLSFFGGYFVQMQVALNRNELSSLSDKIAYYEILQDYSVTSSLEKKNFLPDLLQAFYTKWIEDFLFMTLIFKTSSNQNNPINTIDYQAVYSLFKAFQPNENKNSDNHDFMRFCMSFIALFEPMEQEQEALEEAVKNLPKLNLATLQRRIKLEQAINLWVILFNRTNKWHQSNNYLKAVNMLWEIMKLGLDEKWVYFNQKLPVKYWCNAIRCLYIISGFRSITELDNLISHFFVLQAELESLVLTDKKYIVHLLLLLWIKKDFENLKIQFDIYYKPSRHWDDALFSAEMMLLYMKYLHEMELKDLDNDFDPLSFFHSTKRYLEIFKANEEGDKPQSPKMRSIVKELEIWHDTILLSQIDPSLLKKKKVKGLIKSLETTNLAYYDRNWYIAQLKQIV